MGIVTGCRAYEFKTKGVWRRSPPPHEMGGEGGVVTTGSISNILISNSRRSSDLICNGPGPTTGGCRGGAAKWAVG
jgi:hypothetical protein